MADPASDDEAIHRVLAAAHARVPRATYRLQFHHGFTFRDARALVPYLDALGVSDVYASPFLKARPGSLHGYDIVDHNALNPEIGTREELAGLAADLRARGMGLVLDFVPNHMGIGSENPWWTDVLENGPSSLYSGFFDIAWQPLQSKLEAKVLLPVLGDAYGKVLDEAQLVLELEGGTFVVRYFEKVLPVNPRSYAMLLEPVATALAAELGEEDEAVLELLSIVTGFTNLPPRTETRRARGA
ncbi:MAG TPA: alpha-amylase family glycosyl hydrolase, partial [Minicystis sp.]|nr:alpha-amylase family glycosyl hydrolase [Minicystis sp.]